MRISSEVVAASLEVEGVGVGGAVATAEESIFELRWERFYFFIEIKG